MATTDVAVVIDTDTGKAIMVVVPDNPEQLKDPSFNPPNTAHIIVPIEQYRITTSEQLHAVIVAAEVSQWDLPCFQQEIEPVSDVIQAAPQADNSTVSSV